MAKSKVYLTASGGKTKEGAVDAAFIVNADDADDFAKRLKGNAPVETRTEATEAESAKK